MKRLRRLLIGALLVFLGVLAYERFLQPPSGHELAGLRQERDRLALALERRLGSSLAEVPSDALVIGIPAKLGERLGREMVTAFVPELALTLTNLDVEQQGDLHGKLLVGRSRLGRFTVNLHIDRATASLRPGKAAFAFEAGRVNVSVPVSLVEGTGRGRLRFRWDGRGVAGAVCGDVDVSGAIGGRVVPDVYTIAGGFSLATQGSTLVAHPELSNVKLRLRIEPDAQTWRIVDDAMRRQGAVCRGALAVANVKDKVRAAIDKGFPLTVPPGIVPDVPFPATMEGGLSLTPAGLKVSRGRLWFGAHAQVSP